MSDESDHLLIGLALEGHRDELKALLQRYSSVVFAFVRREVTDVHYQEDLVQETFLHAIRDLHKLKDRSKFRAWLVAIARNRCRVHHRSPSRTTILADDQAMQMHMTRLGRTYRGSNKVEIEDALEAIPATQRRTVAMFYLDGLSIKAIADQLKRPQGTVKTQLFHARRALGRILDDDRNEKE
jgi:RNA polymerase sigma-70 factor, ECF subfamily